MLSRADADLAQRDAALPALAMLLDPSAMTDVLCRSFPEMGAVCAAICYIRYKPETSCLVGYRLADGAAVPYATAVTYRHDASVKWANCRDQAAQFVLEDRGLAISFFPTDAKLRALRLLSDDVGRRRLIARLASRNPEWWSGTVDVIRYKPNRRFVGALTAGCERRAVIKAYTPVEFLAARLTARAFRSTDRVKCPAAVGRSSRRCALAWEWHRGTPLVELIGRPSWPTTSAAAIGVALADVHSQNPVGLPFRRHDDRAHGLVAVAKWLAFVCPPVAARARHLADRLVQRLANGPISMAALHGDCHPGQFLVDGESITAIDFDEAHRGDASYDLGTFLAHLEAGAIRGHFPADRAAAVAEAVLGGYRCAASLPVVEDRIRLQTAAGLLRLAAHPFRSREPQWPIHTRQMLERAETLLPGGTVRVSATPPRQHHTRS